MDDESAGNDLINDPNLFYTRYKWVDVLLNCSYTTFDANYTWANGALHNTSFTPSPNGTLAEIYHGDQKFASVAGGAPELQVNRMTAALQNTSDSFAREWANLYSVEILGVLGAYTTPRTNLEEQTCTSILVSKVPKAPLGALLAFSLGYVVLGAFLGTAGYRASSADVRALAKAISLSAVVGAALDTEKGENFSGGGMVERSGLPTEVEKDALELLAAKGRGGGTFVNDLLLYEARRLKYS